MEKDIFTPEQIAKLRESWAPLKRVDPDRALSSFKAIFDKCNNDQLVQLVRAKINFVSLAAHVEAKHRGITVS